MSSGCLTKAGTKSFYEHVSPYLHRESPIPSLFHLLFFLHTEVESQTWAYCTSAVPLTYSPSPSQFQLRYAGVGQRDSSEDKGCLLPNLMTQVQFPENQLLTLFSDFHMCHSMYTYAITGARTRAHTHYNLALKCPPQVHVSSVLSLACRALWKCVEPLGGGI